MLNEIKDMFTKWREHKGAFGLIFSLIADNRKRIVLLVLLSAACSALAVICSFSVRIIIDGVGSDYDGCRLAGYGILLLLSAMCAYFTARYRKRTGEELYRQTGRSFLQSVMYKEWLSISAFRTGDLISRMEDDGGQVVGFAANTYPNVLSALVKLLFVIPIVAMVSPLLLLFLLLLALVSAIVMGAMRARILPIQKKAREEEAETEACANETLSNLLTVRSLGKEDYFLEKWERRAGSRLAAVNKRNDFQTGSGLAFDILTTVGYFSVFAWALIMLGRGSLSYGTLSMLIVLQGYIQEPISTIVEGVPQLIWTSVSADRMNEIMESEGATLRTDGPGSNPGKVTGIKAENVTFAYGNKTIFDGFSFDIKPGEFVSIRGASGSGKTTLLMLILGLLKPANGRIYFYNDEGKCVQAGSSILKHVGYVPQKNTLFKGTIRENICLCIPKGTESSDDMIRKALYLADALDFVSGLEGGVDYEIGERSSGLSEGQAQRLAIARALLAEPDILIFDEATSALDINTEKRILDRISSMEKRPTLLFATHRLASDDIVDRIISIDAAKDRQ